MILLICLIVFNYYYQNSIKPVSTDKGVVDSKTSESDELLDNNKKIIENAVNTINSDSPLITKDDVLLGDLSASVKIIAYLDYTCSFCADLALNLDAVMKEYDNKIVLAVRHFPMRTNTDSFVAALSLECAGEQDKYWDMHNLVYRTIRTGTSSGDMYGNIASEIDLNISKFNECTTGDDVQEKIIKQTKEAKAFGVIGTPTMYINDKVYPGAIPLDDFVDSQGISREGLRSIIEDLLG